MKLINLTPHDINLYQGEECVLSIPSSGVLRAEEKINSTSIVEFNGVGTTIVNKNYGYPTIDGQVFEDKNLFRDYVLKLFGTEETKSIMNHKIVVSYLTLASIQYHFPGLDYCFITTDNPVRDELGKIIGCRGFAQ